MELWAIPSKRGSMLGHLQPWVMHSKHGPILGQGTMGRTAQGLWVVVNIGPPNLLVMDNVGFGVVGHK